MSVQHEFQTAITDYECAEKAQKLVKQTLEERTAMFEQKRDRVVQAAAKAWDVPYETIEHMGVETIIAMYNNSIKPLHNV